MSPKLYVYNMLWMTWYHDKRHEYNPVRIMHEMRSEKWEMVWYEWKTIARLYLIMLKMEKYWDLMHYVCSCIGRYPYSITRVRTRTPLGTRTIIMSYIMLLWQLLILTSVRHKELLEHSHPIRKGAQRCGNWLVSSYSHVWAVCRVYDTHPSCPLK